MGREVGICKWASLHLLMGDLFLCRCVYWLLGFIIRLFSRRIFAASRGDTLMCCLYTDPISTANFKIHYEAINVRYTLVQSSWCGMWGIEFFYFNDLPSGGLRVIHKFPISRLMCKSHEKTSNK